MDPERVKAVQDWPTPGKLKNVQEFLGFANFYRRFIRGYSAMAKGLTDLLKKSKDPFRLTEAGKQSFQKLKDAFTAYPVLRQFDPSKPIFVETDASVFAIGAILSQLGEDGRRHPVAYYSKKLTPEETRYGTPDQELLAIVYSMEHWRYFLEGAQHQVTVLSDHNNLRWFNSTANLSRRQVGLWMKLSKFDYVINHRPGAKNPADGLSRRADYAVKDEADQGPTPFLNLAATSRLQPLNPSVYLCYTMPEVIRRGYQEALKDDAYAQDLLGGEELPDEWKLNGEILSMDDRLYVPPSLRLKVLDMCHDAPLAGHYGQQRTQKLVERNYFWPGLATYVKDYVQGCYSCRRNKPSTYKAYGLLEPYPAPEGASSRVGIDFITGLPKTSEGHNCIIVIIDAYIKIAYFEPTSFKGLTAKKTACIIRQRCVRYHGLPNTWITDQGS